MVDITILCRWWRLWFTLWRWWLNWWRNVVWCFPQPAAAARSCRSALVTRLQRVEAQSVSLCNCNSVIYTVELDRQRACEPRRKRHNSIAICISASGQCWLTCADHDHTVRWQTVDTTASEVTTLWRYRNWFTAKWVEVTIIFVVSVYGRPV